MSSVIVLRNPEQNIFFGEFTTCLLGRRQGGSNTSGIAHCVLKLENKISQHKKLKRTSTFLRKKSSLGVPLFFWHLPEKKNFKTH